MGATHVRFAAIVNLNTPGHYLHWCVIQISYGNAIVVGLMVLAFVAALVIPFPKHRDEEVE